MTAATSTASSYPNALARTTVTPGDSRCVAYKATRFNCLRPAPQLVCVTGAETPYPREKSGVIKCNVKRFRSPQRQPGNCSVISIFQEKPIVLEIPISRQIPL
jgi:hypothetical protein